MAKALPPPRPPPPPLPGQMPTDIVSPPHGIYLDMTALARRILSLTGPQRRVLLEVLERERGAKQ